MNFFDLKRNLMMISSLYLQNSYSFSQSTIAEVDFHTMAGVVPFSNNFTDYDVFNLDHHSMVIGCKGQFGIPKINLYMGHTKGLLHRGKTEEDGDLHSTLKAYYHLK
jgi:hypothetical protein